MTARELIVSRLEQARARVAVYEELLAELDGAEPQPEPAPGNGDRATAP